MHEHEQRHWRVQLCDWRVVTGLASFPADFDGDSRSDFLLYNSASGVFYKAINRGAGVFTSS